MIYKAITDDYYFWNWLKHSDYSNNFSLEGAKAVQAWFEELSEETPERTIEFDPIGWCVEFTEYDSYKEAWQELVTRGRAMISKRKALKYFQDRTTVIELDNGHIILGEF